MHNLCKSLHITFALGILSALALVVSNLALMDIQNGDGLRLE